jgi:hypothetical protein
MTRDDPSTVLAILGDGTAHGNGGDAAPGMRVVTAQSCGIFPPVRTGNAKRDAENKRTHALIRFAVPDDSELGRMEWEDRAQHVVAIQAEAAKLFFAANPEQAALFQKPELPEDRTPQSDVIYTPLRRR